MHYNVVVTIDAEQDLDHFLWYLIFKKENKQAALNVLNDFEKTKDKLSLVAGSLPDCERPRLKKQGYKRMNFLHHRYFLLYRLEENTVFIDHIFHELQDLDNIIR